MTPKSQAIYAAAIITALLALVGCENSNGRAAKRDAAAIQRGVVAAQDDNTSLSAANEKQARQLGAIRSHNTALRQENAAARSDAQRIDDKATVLRNSDW